MIELGLFKPEMPRLVCTSDLIWRLAVFGFANKAPIGALGFANDVHSTGTYSEGERGWGGEGK